MRILKTLTRKVFELAVIALTCVLMLDGIIYFILHNPQSMPDNPLTKFIRLVNIASARPQPAYDPACSQYDFDVNYRYKPGQCRHQSWEFDVTIKANSLGFPDDEDSLSQPEIIILGDSYAAGWGVEFEQGFPALLEEKTGIKVLAIAAPSYATGRELALLKEVDLSNVKTVVIQYSENDAFENLTTFRNKGVRPIHHSEYRAVSKTNLKRARYLNKPYLPGKYLYLIYQTFQQPKTPNPPTNEARAEHLLGIIERSLLVEMKDVNIVIISIYEVQNSDLGFYESLNARLSLDEARPGFYRRITAINTREFLSKQDYFILDDHLRPSGHEKLADLLVRSIE